MKRSLPRGLPIAMLLVAMTACTPSLNWRGVQLGRLDTLLPCKPDTATRQVELAGQSLVMDMVGCEAGGALFAISRIKAADAQQASMLLRVLRQASLDNVRMQVAKPSANSGNAETSLDLLVDGQRPDGSPLQARFRWLQFDTEVYQLAAYAPLLSGDLTDGLLSDARLR
jgi:hypothetical protein